VAADLRGGGADGGVVTLQALERLALERAGEEGAFQRVQLAGHVVVLVKVAVVEHLGEDFFGQDVLDQHLAHVGIGQRGVDGFLRVHEEFFFGRAKAGVALVRGFDHLAQRAEHGRQIGLELIHGGAKARNFGPLESEEEFEQFRQRNGVNHGAAHDLLPVLDEHHGGVVAEDDVVLRVTFFEFLGDLFVQIVGGVFGFPVAQWHAQLVQQGTVQTEDQIVLTTPSLEQVFERLADDGLALATADLFDDVELLEVVVDQELAHGFPKLALRCGGGGLAGIMSRGPGGPLRQRLPRFPP